jgi:NADH-quinone oxidoreductase subunit G
MDMKIIVDGKVIPARQEQNVLAACLSAKIDVPYFCWHPALGSVGSCRQCAVKLFRGPADADGQIVMGCMTQCRPGMRVSVADAQAAAFREAVIETVLTGHPHDCPVCEVGGECHLQDMSVLTGHDARRYRFPKRTHLNQNLGPFIRHEMNRCIGCYRCVRFYRDYAGGDDFGVFGANRNVYFGRQQDGALESNFAGNLAEVCPTGVFVDKPFSAAFRRKWDMRATPSVCPHCAVGCNITINEREGKFRRVTNRYNETLNGYFLCDRGRFGAGFIESPQRLRSSHDRTRTRLSHRVARERLSEILRDDGIIGIGSPRASVEANFALREMVGAANFYAGVSDFEASGLAAAVEIMRQMRLATVKETEQADAVLLLGDDPALVAPRLALALRQAATRPSPDLLAARGIPAWDDGAARNAASGAKTTPFIQNPQNVAAIADQIRGGTPAEPAAAALLAAKSPLVVAGGDASNLYIAANIVLALRQAGVAARLSLLLPEANSIGLGLLDCRPLSEALAVATGKTVIVLENNPLAHDGAEEILGRADKLCVLDHIETPCSGQADLAIAVGSFADSDGTFINQEGRVQRYFKAIFGADDPPQSWKLLRDAGVAAGRLDAGQWETHGALLAAIAAKIPALASPEQDGAKPATLPHRYSGRTAANAHHDVREAMPWQHDDSPLGTTMEGPPVNQHDGLVPVIWSPGWNSAQAVNKFQDGIGGALAGARDLFVFEDLPETLEYFDVPAPMPADDRVLGIEELSALSPAIIARRGA